MTRVPRILLADDDDDLLQVLETRFRRLGVDVVAVQSGLAAAEAIEGMDFDLICLDIAMPSGDGLGICRMMANEPRWARIPVIVLSGRSDRTTIQHCTEMRVFHVAKGMDVWSRVEPLVCRLLKLQPSGAIAG